MEEPGNTSMSSGQEDGQAIPQATAVANQRKRQLQNVSKLWESLCTSAFVIGSALLIFASARNSVTWHLQRFWGATGDYWQSHWKDIHAMFGESNFKMAMLGTFLVSNCVFVGFNLFLIVLDLTGKPKFLLRYKIQPDQNTPLDPKKFAKALGVVVFNQTVIGIPAFYVTFLAMEWRGCSFGLELPTFHWVLFELAIFSLVDEFFFYYSHRMCHHRLLYKHIHKMHHEWTAPIGITALYAHPLEHLVCNLLPPIMGPLIMGSHIGTCWLWFSVALMSTTVSHCGYHFPLLPSPEAHDFHHYKFVNNFGVLGVLDRLHGTDSLFRKTPAYQRHVMLLSLTPMSQQYPDDPKSPKHKAMKCD